MTHTEEDLQAAVDAYNALGLTLNIWKTQVLFQASPDHPQGWKQPDIKVGDQCLSSVDHFTYLGSCLSCKADLDVETQACLKSACAALGRLRERVCDNRNIYINTNIKVYKTIILPTLLYGSEAWTTYSRHLKNHERYHQSCLHGILNIKWQDKQTNSSVLEEANVTIIESSIVKNQLHWAGHLVCIPLSVLPKKIQYGKLTNGRRNQRVAEQWKCFKGILKHNLKQCSIKHMKWEQLANEQPSWRSAIHTGVAHSEQQRKEHSEELCLARKERQQDASVVPSSTEVTCPVCRSILSSRIGLYSQQQTHVNLVNFI